MFFGMLIVAGILIVVKYFLQSSPAPTTSSQTSGTSNNVVGAVVKKVNVTTPYYTPGGQSQVGFTLGIDQNGIIATIITAILGRSNTEIAYQQRFATFAPTVLKGKKLSDLSAIDRVGGASLTTGAFNASLSKLKTQL